MGAWWVHVYKLLLAGKLYTRMPSVFAGANIPFQRIRRSLPPFIRRKSSVILEPSFNIIAIIIVIYLGFLRAARAL